MKLMTRLTLVLLATGLAPWHSCKAGDGAVTGDTRYKFSQSDKVLETAPKTTQLTRTASTRKTRRVAPRWWQVGAHLVLFARR